jgi:hypothetical protein
MEEPSRSMKQNHVPKGPREEVADVGVPGVAAAEADLEEDEAAGAVVAAAAAVVAEAEADLKAGADEAAVRVIDSNRSVFIHRDPLPD